MHAHNINTNPRGSGHCAEITAHRTKKTRSGVVDKPKQRTHASHGHGIHKQSYAYYNVLTMPLVPPRRRQHGGGGGGARWLAVLCNRHTREISRELPLYTRYILPHVCRILARSYMCSHVFVILTSQRGRSIPKRRTSLYRPSRRVIKMASFVTFACSADNDTGVS